MSAADSKKVVIAALAGNLAIATCKFGAAFLSSSTATLAEAVHSLADSGNQGLLLVGLRLAARPPDDKFPFGRSAEKYFWAFVVALMLFSVGGAFAIYEGILHLTHLAGHVPENRVLAYAIGNAKLSFDAIYLNYAILGVSVIFESMSFRVAFREFRVMAGGKNWFRFLVEARDPTIPLVMAEDAAALVGLSVALTAVILSQVTGNEYWDPIGSMVIGALLTFVAITLARVTHGLLIGKAARPEERQRVLDITKEVPGIVRVTQMLTMHLGPDVVILALKVAFSPELALHKVEDTINDLEARLRKELPDMKKIFVEPDSKGDGRGVEFSIKRGVVAQAGAEVSDVRRLS